MMNQNHPSFDIIGSEGSSLSGKKIALGICGSVAVMKILEAVRLLMRQGAQIIPFMTQGANKLVGPDLVHWATGNKPILELSGAIEHVWAAGNVQGKVDLILVAPATANTIGKIASGIDDTVVTTLLTTGFGEGIPLLIIPAMHEPMYRHPIVKENIDKLTGLGVHFLLPKIEEGKAKIQDPEHIRDQVIQLFKELESETKIGFHSGESKSPVPSTISNKTLAGKKILLSAGRTVEYIDPIRVISNNSTGKMGMALAQAALNAGAQVTLVYGKGTVSEPAAANTIHVDTTEEMKNAIYNELDKGGYHAFIAAAAVGDWMVAEPSKTKIPTHGAEKITIELLPTPKIIDTIKELHPQLFLVAFRAQQGLGEQELLDDAESRMKKAKADMIVVNDVGKKDCGFESDTNEVFLIDSTSKIKKLSLAAKRIIAEQIIEELALRI